MFAGRPVDFRVSGAGALVKCSGPGLQQGVEDWESSFTVDASRAYKHIDSLQVKVEGQFPQLFTHFFPPTQTPTPTHTVVDAINFLAKFLCESMQILTDIPEFV